MTTVTFTSPERSGTPRSFNSRVDLLQLIHCFLLQIDRNVRHNGGPSRPGDRVDGQQAAKHDPGAGQSGFPNENDA